MYLCAPICECKLITDDFEHLKNFLARCYTVVFSVADPDSSDPYLCFWASRIQIRTHYSEVWIRILLSSCKKL
jgi:hypothetical protein